MSKEYLHQAESSPPTKGRADLNIYGKIQRTSSDQRRCRRLNTSSTSWLGCKATSTTRICSQVGLVSYVPLNSSIAAVLKGCAGVPFPKSFPTLLRQLFKRLYRVYAHIYCHHYPVVVQLGLEPHLNTSFKHYVLFIDEHGLASGKDFWGPLGDLVDSMLKSD